MTFSPIELQVMWNRLIAVVEEQAQTLIRTAFGTATREAGDLSAGAFLPDGRMVAQAVTGTPGHVNSMANSVMHFLRVFPPEATRPGDVFITNDPWMGTGHYWDLTVVTPTFRQGRLVGYFACTCHVVDIGGVGLGVESRQVYHEGLAIPIMRLADANGLNEHLLQIVRANVREPVQVEGDIYSLIACNDVGARRLVEMMDEFAIDDLTPLGSYIIDQSRAAMLKAIRALPAGTYRNTMRIDGIEAPIDLVCTLTIAADGIAVDFAGTSGMSSYAINVPICYTEAYASFGVQCVVAPGVPNNAGTLGTVKVTAPVGTILNAPRPAPVASRHMVGQMLPDMVFGCLHQAVPDRVPAEGTSCLWNLRLSGGTGLPDIDPNLLSNATPFNITSFHSGGAGARPTKDGLSATAFPSGVRNVPIEVTEALTPLVFWRKEYRTDSGGAGTQRGGLGQVMELENGEGSPFAISATFDRVVHPPRGRVGGLPGMTGRLTTRGGRTLRAKGRQSVAADDRLIIEFPGGGGYGDPLDRAPERVAADVRLEFVSAEAARRDYGVVLDAAGGVDVPATEALRARRRASRQAAE
ncbi:MAG: hydantoinase B/oxoprolinase family protein [Alphaproteobacteria bacterium]|nr:hydantoinase B/oxoprolinase family protein [Alphaproteobacteria bacterium]